MATHKIDNEHHFADVGNMVLKVNTSWCASGVEPYGDEAMMLAECAAALDSDDPTWELQAGSAARAALFAA